MFILSLVIAFTVIAVLVTMIYIPHLEDKRNERNEKLFNLERQQERKLSFYHLSESTSNNAIMLQAIIKDKAFKDYANEWDNVASMFLNSLARKCEASEDVVQSQKKITEWGKIIKAAVKGDKEQTKEYNKLKNKLDDQWADDFDSRGRKIKSLKKEIKRYDLTIALCRTAVCFLQCLAMVLVIYNGWKSD